MERIDAIVIGAGVVGLACARALAIAGRDVVVLESSSAVGTGTSSRNSEVIHAGLYYAPGSLKARLCVAGRHLLYAYCDAHQVAYRRCGKLIVATAEEQVPELSALAERGRANGVSDIQFLSRDEVSALEPEIRCEAALMSPSSGILDSHAFMSSLYGELERAGGAIAFQSPVVGGRLDHDGVTLELGDSARAAVKARIVVNAAGLGAQALARSIAGVPPETVAPLHLAKGSYFNLGGRSPFAHLVYPIPSLGGLGVHATLDLAGRVRFGPDIEWVDDVDYNVDPARSVAFYAAVRAYWPGLPNGALLPAYAGIRPKIARPGGPSTDFGVQRLPAGGATALINLYGIESPGLTSALALADLVSGLASRHAASGELALKLATAALP